MTEKILRMRKLFDELPRDMQFREYRRIERILHDKATIKMSPVDKDGIAKDDIELTFHCMGEVIKYLHNYGYPNATSSNIYKALKGTNNRSCPYGHKYSYDYD